MPEKKTAQSGRSTSNNRKQPPSAGAGKKAAQPAKAPDRPAKSTRQPAPPKAAKAPKTAGPSGAQKAARRPNIPKKPSLSVRLSTFARRTGSTLKNPAFWRGLITKLPPWTDEIGALLLIVLGVVTLTALFNSASEAVLAITISKALRQVFGSGAYLVPLAILAVGVIILLPKFGMSFRIGWLRLLGVELAFSSLEALLHLIANDPEARALARSGGGGGYFGWALSQLTIGLLGRSLSIVLYGILFAVGVILLTGLRYRHLLLGVAWLGAQFQQAIHYVENTEARIAAQAVAAKAEGQPMAKPREEIQPAAAAEATTRTPYSRPSVVSRADEAGPALAPAARGPRPDTPPVPTTGTEADSKPEKHEVDEQTRRSRLAQQQKMRLQHPDAHPLSKDEKKALVERTRHTLGAANGRSLVAPGEPGTRDSIVPREFLPDARVVPATPRARMRHKQHEPSERYFTVEDFREVKKVGKRDDGLPPLELLSDVELNVPTEEEINTNAKIIKNTLLEFDVEVEVIDVKVGPTVTQYAVSPYTETVNAEGEMILNRVRVSQIANLADDLALALSAKRLRIQAPVPGHSYVGVEVPNRQPSTVALRPVLESESFYRQRKRPLALPLGRDVSGEPFIADLQSMPHLLIAGTTGSGKSIMLAAMTSALVLNNSPEQVRLVLLDPKMVELSRFNGLPHLLGPVETELDRIIEVLRWATREMDKRYKLLEKEAARNIEVYNRALGRRRQDEHLPYIVIIVDEIGDLMMQRPDETERALTRLAQMARAVGIHLMVATQRPSVDVITGLIKANFPARISFAVASGIDSRVILDTVGAETLMGRGDMLFLAPDAAGPQRVQGCYVSDDEVNRLVQYWAEWHAQAIEAERIEPVLVAPWERGMTRREVLAETDAMLEDAIALVIEEGEASASLIQRRLGLGYPRAARLMDLMHELGIVGAARPGGRSREVLVKPGADPFKNLVDQRLKKKP
ncbi:MAG: DNA translocase FtsK [Chloroflexi bacterium]|nr:DNA translocase FtsK [Chloroflexota bacterium]